MKKYKISDIYALDHPDKGLEVYKNLNPDKMSKYQDHVQTNISNYTEEFENRSHVLLVGIEGLLLTAPEMVALIDYIDANMPHILKVNKRTLALRKEKEGKGKRLTHVIIGKVTKEDVRDIIFELDTIKDNNDLFEKKTLQDIPNLPEEIRNKIEFLRSISPNVDMITVAFKNDRFKNYVEAIVDPITQEFNESQGDNDE